MQNTTQINGAVTTEMLNSETIKSLDVDASSVDLYRNATSDSYHSYIVYRFVADYIFHYGRHVTCSLAVLTNLLVVAVMIRCWTFWKYSTGILIMTLACVDIILNVLDISYLYSPQPYTKMTIVIYYFSVTLSNVSNQMMLLISIHRYALVGKPFSHHRVTSKKSTLLQITILTVCLLAINIYIFLSTLNGKTFVTLLISVSVLLSNIVPILVSTVLTLLVIREFTKSAESVNAAGPRRGERNITKAMTAVNVAFFILTLPHGVSTVYIMVKIIINKGQYQYYVDFCIEFFLLLIRDINCSVNVFIYTAYIPMFRTTLFNLIRFN